MDLCILINLVVDQYHNWTSFQWSEVWSDTIIHDAFDLDQFGFHNRPNGD